MQSNCDKVPWRTPILHKKYSDIILSFLIHDFALLYNCNNRQEFTINMI